jgi:hypothetical protein
VPLSTRHRYTGISVILFKNVGRQKLSGTGANALAVSTRFGGQKSILDVTGFLGEQGSVRVNKSVREPAGSFSVEFTDQLVPTADDDLYGLFEPMDVVEIRMAANSFQYVSPSSGRPLSTVSGATSVASPTSPMPIMMRGFISSVTRSQAIGSDGKPTRKVIISGQDYGKIWQIYNIYFNPFMLDQGNYITQFKLFTRFGIAFQTQPAGSLVKDIFAKIINPFIATMGANAAGVVTSGSSPLLPIKTDIQVQDGNVAPFGVNDWQGGSIHSLIRSFCDTGPWNELYIEDREEGPFVVFRPNPFLVAGGDPSSASAYINKNTTLPAVTKIDSSSVISIEVTRSDANVANYYWVEAPQYDLNFQFVGKAMAATGGPADTFDISTYGNSASALYGFKRMAESTNQFSPNTKSSGGTEKTQNLQDASSSSNWIGMRRSSLISQNRDNVVFESGTIRLVGNETVKAGTYLSFTHGNMVSSYYVVDAAHHYSPFGTYTTTARVERGTGFIDRAQRGAGSDSPYLAELADSQTPTP